MKSDDYYWHEVLSRYKASKLIRRLRHKFGLTLIAGKTNTTRQYVYAIQEMTIKPNADFISKLERLQNDI